MTFAPQSRGNEELGAEGRSGAAAAAAHELYIVEATDGGAVSSLRIARLGGAYLESVWERKFVWKSGRDGGGAGSGQLWRRFGEEDYRDPQLPAQCCRGLMRFYRIPVCTTLTFIMLPYSIRITLCPPSHCCAENYTSVCFLVCAKLCEVLCRQSEHDRQSVNRRRDWLSNPNRHRKLFTWSAEHLDDRSLSMQAQGSRQHTTGLNSYRNLCST